jgi:hypothetical protein
MYKKTEYQQKKKHALTTPKTLLMHINQIDLYLTTQFKNTPSTKSCVSSMLFWVSHHFHQTLSIQHSLFMLCIMKCLYIIDAIQSMPKTQNMFLFTLISPLNEDLFFIYLVCYQCIHWYDFQFCVVYLIKNLVTKRTCNIFTNWKSDGSLNRKTHIHCTDLQILQFLQNFKLFQI